MRSKTGPARVLAGASFALLACRLAAAAPAGGFSLSPTGRLEAGSTIAVSWGLDPSTAAEADEMELVLSLDGGVSFPIRLTGRIAPETRSVIWRVPVLPTERARIALRAGSGEEADTEEMLFASEPFAIDAPRGSPGEELASVNGEWRTREALDAPSQPLDLHMEPGHAEGDMEPLDPDSIENGIRPARLAAPDSRGGADVAGETFATVGIPQHEPPIRTSLPLRL